MSLAVAEPSLPLAETGELIAKTSPDQLVVNGIVGDGVSPGFDAAVIRHRLLDAIVRASERG